MSETYKLPAIFDNHLGIVIGPRLDGDSDEIQGITTDSDQPAQGPNVATPNGLWIKTRSTNTGLGYFGFSSDVDSDDFELTADQYAPPIMVDNMNKVWFYTATVGDKFCLIKG